MKYGLIGEHLSHSYSKEVHSVIADYEYEIVELTETQVIELMKSKDFSAVNVTIPYKQTVIPYLDCIDEHAKKIGAVNTVINRGGKLFGYNTDYAGMTALINRSEKSFKDKTVLILGGDGGTAKTAFAVTKDLDAKEIYRVSRKEKDGFITYDEAKYIDANVIINTTPVGMYPNCDNMPIDISVYKNLTLVIDAIYNPLRSKLVLEAEKRGITAEGGLYMLTSQAVFACEHFIDKHFDKSIFDKAFYEVKKSKENIILTGMPGSGKTTVGKLLAKKLKTEFFDTDNEIEKKASRTPEDIITKDGEEEFRRIESEVIKELTKDTRGSVIATGGGAVLKPENIFELKKDGKIFFIDRDIKHIIPTSSRPLSDSLDKLKKKYEERYGIYKSTCDKIVVSDNDVDHTVNKITEEINK